MKILFFAFINVSGFFHLMEFIVQEGNGSPTAKDLFCYRFFQVKDEEIIDINSNIQEYYSNLK